MRPTYPASLFLSAALCTLPANAGRRVPPPEFVPPTTNLHLRAAFDTDPSVYLGRFIPDGALIPDEATARTTACSQYMRVRKVGGGNVEYDEVFSASFHAALGLGIPKTEVALGGRGNKSASLRAKYTLTNKLVADISDPVAFASCCRKSPSECTGQFVSEFIEGSGSIWTVRSSSSTSKVREALEEIGLEVEAHNGVTWGRARNFPSPVYFAFRVTEVPKVDCKSLVNSPPPSEQGWYFGAVTEPLPSEKIARDAAMAGVREQAVKFVGVSIVNGSVSSTVVGGPAGAAAALFEDEEFVRRAATGIARFVKDELTCVEESSSVDGPRYTVRTLAFMPLEALDDAARAALGK